MCMTFGCNPQINFCHFFSNLDLVILGLKAILRTQLLLQFYLDLFETLQVFLSKSIDVHDIWM